METGRTTTKRFLGMAAAALLVAAAPGSALAADRYGGLRADVHLDLGWHEAFGAGLRLELPIAARGLLHGVDDDLALSFGAEILSYDGRYGRVGVVPLAAVQWNFYLSPSWSLFPELGLAVPLGYHPYYRPADLFLGLGGRFHFNRKNALLLRASWPAGLQLGLTF